MYAYTAYRAAITFQGGVICPSLRVPMIKCLRVLTYFSMLRYEYIGRTANTV